MKYRSLALASLCALAVAPVLAFRAAEPATVGQAAPTWTLPDQEGKSHSLAGLKGKYVVLEWYNKDCPFVKKHYGSGNMQKLQKWAKDKGVVWLSVISSKEGAQGYLTADQAKDVIKANRIESAAIVFDTDGKVGKAYGAKTTPHMYVIDPKGTLIYNGGIDDKPTPSPADIATSRNHVKAALEESMAGKPVSVATSQPYGCNVKY
jgi:peroxiredoxin